MEVESWLWDYQTVLSCNGKDVNFSFCPVPTPEVQEEIFPASVTQTSDLTQASPTKEQGERPKFGP